ncbi:MAG: cobalt-zinc-cadmium efflux system membrane fusion protein [Candidatus Omnitrophota bacterium]|jgi:cobalt-zinc-cadmium efflux system membrane fusion protein
MNKLWMMMVFGFVLILGQPTSFVELSAYAQEGGHEEEKEQERGPKGGKLYRSGKFAVEVKIVEANTPPRFHVYAYSKNKIIDPTKVNLKIELKRIDGEINRYDFIPEKGSLVSNGIVPEPHSFDVKIHATYKGKTHQWEFESHEGRTQISEQAAREAGVKAEKAGGATIGEYTRLTGQITLNRNSTAQIRARFPGIVKSVNAMWGQDVKKGDVLAKIEANESLNVYDVVAPMDGIILTRNTNIGDVARDIPLFTLADLSEVWAEFHVFPSDLPKIAKGQIVNVYTISGVQNKTSHITKAPVKMLLPMADPNSQTVLVIVPLDNSEGVWHPGMTVRGEVLVDEKYVPLAVKTSALQSFLDFTVVFAKFGDTYEVRMLDLGMNDGEMVEVLAGLKSDTEYVTQNSFLIKADIEKSGAGHDH